MMSVAVIIPKRTSSLTTGSRRNRNFVMSFVTSQSGNPAMVTLRADVIASSTESGLCSAAKHPQYIAFRQDAGKNTSTVHDGNAPDLLLCDDLQGIGKMRIAGKRSGLPPS